MRISDWSSDVCSSDLVALGILDDLRSLCHLDRAGLVNAGGNDGGLAARDSRGGVRIRPGNDLHHAFQGVVMVTWVDAFRGVTEGKIRALPQSRGLGERRTTDLLSPLGRASCRDRGCQYVYISVG